jgi:adenylate kinase family enzyme
MSDGGGVLPDLSRVVVIGTSCSGKTTFARCLARRLDAPHVELDALYWLPGWLERDKAAFVGLVADRTADAAWVVDGNYRAIRQLIWPRATAVIWLSYPFPLVLWRALKRTVHRAITGQEICNGNRETWRKALFSRESILLWVLTTYHRRQRDYTRLFAAGDYPNAAKIRLQRPAEAAGFLARVRPT